MSYQKIIIVGNLGGDPEMKYLKSGEPVTNLSVAVNRQYAKADGETVKETQWFRVSVWGKQAEACAQYLKKGSSVLVEGRLTPDAASGGPRIFSRQDGTSGASFEIFANTVRFLSTREATGGTGPIGATEEMPAAGEDDIPF